MAETQAKEKEKPDNDIHVVVVTTAECLAPRISVHFKCRNPPKC